MNRVARDLTPVVDLSAGIGHRPVPHAAAGLCRPAAALQSRLPGRGEHPGLAGAGAGRRVPPGVGTAGRATTRCRRRMGGSAIIRAKPAAIAGNWTPRCRSTRWNASSATWRRREGWDCPPPRAAQRQARAGGRRRAERAVGRLSPDPARPCGGDPRGRAGGRRHAAFRHPRLSPAARRTGGGDRPHRADGREDRAEPQGDRRAGRARRGQVRRGVRGDRRACRRSTSTSRRATRCGCWMR